MHNTLNTWCARLLLALMSLGLAASAQAVPIDYTITFTLTNGSSAPTAGAFTYDATLPLFTNFLVTWAGADFDLTAAANSPANLGGCGDSATGAALGFRILSGTTPCASNQLWAAFGTSLAGTNRVSLFASSETLGVLLDNVDESITASSALLVTEGLSGGTFTIAPAAATVPEPTSLLLLGTGLLGAAVSRRRPRAS